MSHNEPGYFGTIWRAAKSIIDGMAVTLSYAFRPPITVQYPDRTPIPVPDTLPERYRGFLEVDMDICTACKACERDCPINCIVIDLEKVDGIRAMTRFDIDMGKCMYCGICVENCTSDGIRHTGDYERATHDRDATVVTLFEATFGFEPADEPAAAEEAAAPAEQQQPSTDAEGGEGV